MYITNCYLFFNHSLSVIQQDNSIYYIIYVYVVTFIEYNLIQSKITKINKNDLLENFMAKKN